MIARLLAAIVLCTAFIAACDVHGIAGPGGLARIDVSPDATLRAGATQQMVAVGYDAEGRVVGITPEWAVAASGGVIASTGAFTAGTVTGLFANTVVASVGPIAGRASITVIPGALATITVVPTPVTLAIRGTQQFTAVGKDATGNIVDIAPTWSVVAEGGTIGNTGIFTAGSTAGTFVNTVQASSGGLKGLATVIVTPGALASIVVTPNPTTLTVGVTQRFTALGRDAGGNVVAVTPEWSVVAGGGTIGATSGVFTAGGVLGTFTNTVKARSGATSGTATVTVVLGVLATITIVPNPATMAVGASLQLTAVGRDAGGNAVAISPAWDVVTTPNGASITQDGMYTAGTQVGTFPNKVRASSGGIAGTATIIVTTGVLTSIAVTPNPVFLPTGGTQPFTAVGKDAAGNAYPVTPIWTVVNGGGSIDAVTGLFTAGLAAGTFAGTVVATSGTVSGSATVHTDVILASIVVSPTPVSVQTGGTQQFAAVGRDMAGSPLAITPVWSVVNGGGSIDATTGRFTAGPATGTFTSTVRATIGATSGTATVTVTPTPPALASLTVFPGAATMLINGTQQFEAVGRDALGNLFPSAPVWRVINGGGSIDIVTGLFTAGSVAGVYSNTVEARMGAVTGTATVTITVLPPVLATIVVTPTPQTLMPGGVQQFTAVGTDADGSVIAITPVWSIVAGGGVISGTGHFTAGAVAGTFINTVTASSGSIAGFATVTVLPVAQTITFAAPATPATYGGTFAITPTASSGLVVTVTPSGGCTLSGGTVTMTSGTVACVLTASQAGTGSISAAPDVVQTVAAALRAATVTPAPTGKLFGAADPSPLTTGTLTGFLAGDGVTATYSRVAGEAVGTYLLSATLTPLGVLGEYVITTTPALFTIGVGAQTITFVAPATPATYGGTFAIAPSASSGLVVTVTPSGGCTLSGGTVTMTSGTVACVLTATQAGDATYSAATGVVQTVAAARRAATVTPAATGKLFGAADPSPLTTGTLTGFLAGDGVTATYSRVAGEAVGTYALSATLAPLGVLGEYVITTTPALFTIGIGAQTISFAAPPTPATYGSTFAITPTASSGLVVTVTPTGGCTLSGGTVTMTSGTVACVLTATQPGDATYAAATSIVQTVAAARRAAMVTPAPTGKLFGAADPSPLTTGTLTGFLAGDGVTATYSRVAGEAVGTYALSATLAPVGVLGEYVITITPALFTIGVGAQTISFAAPASPATYGNTFAITPTASSGLSVTVTPTGGCTLSGGTVTMTSGTVACVLTATQPGDATYSAATSIVQTVAAARRAATVTPAPTGKLFGAADPSPLTTGTLTGFLAGDGVTATYSRVAGEAVGTYALSATLAPVGVLGEYVITITPALFTIGVGAQTITFAAPATPATYGNTFAITPTASSGLVVTVTPTGGCTLSGGTVTMTSGTVACVLTASQAGTGSIAAAPDVVQTVAAARRAATVTPAATGKLFGAADPSPLTTGTLTGFLAGDGVTATYNRVAGEAVGTYALSATLTPVGVLGEYVITTTPALFTIGVGAQTITFAAPASPATYGSTFAITPTASSGLVVTVTPTGGCTLSGGTVTMTSGTVACVLTATQPGDATYAAATSIVQTVAAARRAATVTPAPTGKLFGAADPSPLTTGTLTGFLAGDGVTATYSRVAGEAVGTYALSATLTPVGVLGEYVITTTPALFTIGVGAQTITFAALSAKTFADAPFAVSATGGASGNPVTFAAAPAGVCTVTGTTVTLTGVGTCTVTASQAGSASYAAASDVVRSFAVAAAAQAAVAITVPPSATVGQAALAAVAGGGSGTGTYSYASSTSGVCTVGAASGSIVALAAGTCTLSAARAADANYLASASSAPASFVISLVPQTITFAAPATPATYGSTFAIAPTATSGLAVMVTPTGGCTLSGATVTMTSGTTACVLTATQPGDATYAAASSVARTVAASPAAQAAVTLTAPAGGTVGQAGLSAAAGGGSGTGVYGYASSTTAVCTVDAASGSIAALTAGTCSLTATRAADANYLVSASSAAASFTITKATQAVVTLTVPASSTVGEAGLKAVAAGGSGTGAYAYASTTAAVCTVNATTGDITALTVGTCTLTATRATDANYLISATSAPASFTIGLGAAASFAVLGGSGASSCIGASTIAGSVGVSASGSISGFPAPCVIAAPGDLSVHLNDATAAAAQANVTVVTASLAGMACTNDLTGQDLGSMNLAPGVYCFSSAAGLTGTLTLTGPSTGVWVFKVGTALTTTGSAGVTLVGGSAANVYWQVGSSATLGGANAFRGNILAAVSITLGTGTSVSGRALAQTGAVILDTNALTLP